LYSLTDIVELRIYLVKCATTRKVIETKTNKQTNKKTNLF